jgi:hypothetical protein
MKVINKLLILLLFFTGLNTAKSQVKFIGTTNHFIVTGQGDIKQKASDNARIVNWSISNSSTDFETSVYLETLNLGKAGVIIRDATTSNNLEGGRPCYYLYLQKPSNKLRLDVRSTINGLLTNITEISNIQQGLWLSLKKEGNNLVCRYSLSDKTVTTNQVWISVNNLSNALSNYTTFSRGIIVASGSSTPNNATFINWKSLVIPPNTINSPVISSSLNPLTEGNNATLFSTGCNYTINWYKNNTYLSSSPSLSITNAILNDIYNAKCKNGNISSYASNDIVVNSLVNNSTTVIGFVPDMNINDYDKWNYFNPDDIPDFTTTKTTDSKTNQLLPNKWFIWHAPYMNLFGINGDKASRLAKMLKKGVTAFNISVIGDVSGSNSNVLSILSPLNIVSENYGLGINNGNARPEESSYTNFANWVRGGVSNSAGFGATLINGKYNHFLTLSDYENLYTGLTTQTSSNFHTVGLISGATLAIGRVGFQYGLALNTGGYYTSILYNGSNNVWGLPADNSVPAEFIGRSASSNNRIVGVNEITYAYEVFLPENYQVQDQNNANWFNIKHFGNELNSNYSGGDLNNCNAQHWATNIGVGTETAYNVHHNYQDGGQDLIIQLKPSNETDAGFHYDQRYAQYRNNKYANYVNRYGITYLGNGTEALSGTSSEYVPNFIAEGQVELAYFCGAKGINWWSSDFTQDAIPKTKVGNQRRGAKYNDVNYGNRDLTSYVYTLKALWRLNQKVTLSDGRTLSFMDICDGTEEYLNQNTKVVYPNSTTITTLRALDWQITKHSPTRAVLNRAKNAIFVIAFQAYGVEDASIKFIYNDNNANINETIALPTGKIIIKAFPLISNTGVGSTVNPPTIISNPTNPTAGTSTTFTASGCSGLVKWFVGDAQVSSGSVYTVSNPIANTSYFSNCTVSNVISNSSNSITIGVPTSVTITEPNKSQYYFSNGQAPSYYDNINNLPAIFQNTDKYDNVTDLVWLRNDKIKVAINLKRGGQLAWASLIGDDKNLIYNGYDGGFQVQLDAYQKKNGYNQNGKYSRARYDEQGQFSSDPNFRDANNNVVPFASYNVTQGGDFRNYSQSLIDYHSITNGYYVKVRPLFYTIDREVSRTYIETTYTLDGYSVKIDYKYSSFRNDGQYDNNTFDGGHAPVCFLVNNLTNYKSYTGNNAWTKNTNPTNYNSGIESGILPNEMSGETPLTKTSKERWSLVYNRDNNKTIGVYANTTDNDNSYGLKQTNVYPQNGNARDGNEFTGGYTILGRIFDIGTIASPIQNRDNYQQNISSYLIITPDVDTFINKVYQLSGH